VRVWVWTQFIPEGANAAKAKSSQRAQLDVIRTKGLFSQVL